MYLVTTNWQVPLAKTNGLGSNSALPGRGSPAPRQKMYPALNNPSYKYGNPIKSRIVGSSRKRLTTNPTNTYSLTSSSSKSIKLLALPTTWAILLEPVRRDCTQGRFYRWTFNLNFQIFFLPLLNFQTLEMFPVFPVFFFKKEENLEKKVVR